MMYLITPQIVIFVTILLLFCFLLGKLVIHSNENSSPYIMGFILLFIFTYCIAFMITMKYNEMKEKANGKCPEYEKIENVYKLK